MAKKKTSRKAPASAKPSPAASASTSSSGSGSTAKKKTASKKTASKKTASKKAASKKKAVKKAATRKTATKKTASKKKATKKAATRKTTAKKTASKKKAVKKAATRKATTKKTASKKKAASKKAATRKAATAKPKVEPEAPVAEIVATPPVEEIVEAQAPVEPPATSAAAEDTVEASFDALFGESASIAEVAPEPEPVAEVAPEPEPEPEWVPVDEIEPLEQPEAVAEVAPQENAQQETQPAVAEVAPEPVAEIEPEPIAESTPEPVVAEEEPETSSALDGLGWLGEDDPFAEPAAAPAVAAPVNQEGGDEVLLAASERGETGLVRSLLDGGASPSARDRRRATIGWTPLMLAAASGHAEVAALLIAAGADVDATDDPDDRYEARVREMARSLSPDQISAEGMPLGRTALHLATAYGRLEIAKMLVAANCAVDVADHSGERPLMLAAQSGALEMAQLLLESDVDVNARDGRGGTGALERAAMMGHADLVGRLLERGATIDSRDAEERTPLMYAVGGAHYEAARVLLENRANPRAEAASGFCVLCAAVCARGYFPEPDGTFAVRPFPEESILPVVELLLRWGADDAPDSTGVRPSQHAEGLGHFAVVRVLYDYSGEELRKTG